MAFIIPSVAFASWWNPFSWKIFQKKEPTQQVQVEIQKTPEEKISELQKQLDELKKQQTDSTSSKINPTTQIKNTTPKADNVKSTQATDVCLNIAGIQTKTPEGYSWAYGNTCSVINLVDYCPNINGVQSKIPDGMFVYGSNKECLTQNEINYIADKMAEAKNKEIASSTKSTDPIFSEACEDAQDELKKIQAQQDKMDQTNYSALADFVVLKVNPALDKVASACRLDLAPRKIEPTKTTNCYVNYYSSNASITCYGN